MNEQIEKNLNRLKSLVLNDAHEQSERAAQEFENKTNNIIEKKGSEYAVSTEKRKKSAIAKTENILTERTTDGDRPVKKAKDHNKTRSRTERKYRPACHFLARGFKRRKSKAYKSPICRPDRAKT